MGSNVSASISHDNAARLVCLTPGELERLVRDGHVRRNDKNAYSVPILVGDYIEFLKKSMEGHCGHPKQAEVANHLGISERTVRDLEIKLGFKTDYTISEIRLAYIDHLREQAAGRAATGEIELVTERAMLAKAQRERIEMQNEVTRGTLAPAILIEQVLTQCASKIAGIFDAIPGLVHRRIPDVPIETIDLIAGEIAKVRNRVASMSLDDLDEDDLSDDQPESVVRPNQTTDFPEPDFEGNKA